MSSYQQQSTTNMDRPMRFDNIQHYYSPKHESDESEGSASSSSSGGSEEEGTSSSYTDDDNSTAMFDIQDSIRRRPLPTTPDEATNHHHRKVHFRNPTEDTKFDMVMKRVQSVLDKPCEILLLLLCF